MGGGIRKLAKRELLATIRDRYQSSSKKDKSRILDEFTDSFAFHLTAQNLWTTNRWPNHPVNRQSQFHPAHLNDRVHPGQPTQLYVVLFQSGIKVNNLLV